MGKVLEKHGIVLRAIKFICTVSISDLLTGEEVYAAIEYMEIVWFEEILDKIEVDYDSIRWNKIVEEVKEEIHCLELISENLIGLNDAINEMCKKARVASLDLMKLTRTCLDSIFFGGTERYII
jgi:hypothetical protein